MKIDQLDPHTQQALEAAAFRRLLEHLDSRKDVQNIDCGGGDPAVAD